MMKNRLFSILALCLFLAISACTGGIGSKSAPGGDGQGFSGRTSTIILSVDNARVRCSASSPTVGEHTVVCQAAVIAPDGNEYLATQLAEGVSLSWRDVVKLDGPEFEKSCSLSNGNLTQTCDIRPENAAALKLRFDIVVTDLVHQTMESDIVLLPFSVRSFGLVPQLRSYLSQTSDTKVGYQSSSIDSLTTYFGAISSMCYREGNLFFSVDTFIYRYSFKEKSTILFAGSSQLANKNETHRLRISFGSSGITIACRPDSILVASPINKQILEIKDLGPVTILAGTSDKPLKGQPRNILVTKDGSIIFVEHYWETFAVTRYYIRRISPEGILSTLAGHPTGGYYPGEVTDMTEDKNGNLYILDKTNRNIKKLDQNGSLTAVSSSTGFPELAYSIVLGADDSIRLMNGNGVLFQLMANGAFLRLSGTETNSVYGGTSKLEEGRFFLPPPGQGMLLKPDDGSLLVLEPPGGRIRSVQNGLVTTLLGRANEELVVDSSKPNSFILSSGTKVRVRPDKKIYVLESGKHRVHLFDPATQTSKIVIGTGKPGLSGDGGPGTHAALAAPSDIAVGPDGSLYVSDAYNFRIRKVDLNGIASTFAGGGTQTTLPASNPLNIALFPGQIEMGSDGSLYIFGQATSGSEYRIIKINRLGEVSLVYRFEPSSIAYQSTLPFPSSFTVDNSGNIYFTDRNLSVIYMLSGNGSLKVIAGKAYKPTSYFVEEPTRPEAIDGTLALDANLLNPSWLHLGQDGVLYFTEGGTGKIRSLIADNSQGSAFYRIGTFIGTHSGKDCAGEVQGKSTSEKFEVTFSAGLSNICLGIPAGMDSLNTCNRPNGDLRYYFSQSFMPYSNVIEIIRPCPELSRQ